MGSIRVGREGEDLIRLDVEGEIDAEEMRKGIEAFLSVAETLEGFDLLYIVRDMRMPSLAAMRVELGYFGRLWRLIPRMRRSALVANQRWIRTAAKAESAIIPGLTIETFEEEAPARAWLAE